MKILKNLFDPSLHSRKRSRNTMIRTYPLVKSLLNHYRYSFFNKGSDEKFETQKPIKLTEEIYCNTNFS